MHPVFYILLLSLAVHSAQADVGMLDFSFGGKSYGKVIIKKVNPAEATIHHDAGVLAVAIAQLPQELQAALDYDAAAAETFIVSRSIQAEKAASTADVARRKRQEADALALTEERGFRIIQVLSEQNGALAETSQGGGAPGSVQSAVNRISGRPTQVVPARKQTVFITGDLPEEIVDGSYITAKALPDGKFEYMDTFGSQATVQRYRVGFAVIRE